MRKSRTAAGVLLLSLIAGCVHFDLSLPASENPAFKDCVQNPAVSWQAAQRAQSGELRTEPSPALMKQYRQILKAAEEDAAALSEGGEKSVGVERARETKARAAAVTRVVAILRHPAQRRINTLYNGLSGTSAGNSLSFSERQVRHYLDLVSQSTRLDDWSAYADFALESYSKAVDTADETQLREAHWEMRLAIYLEAYFKAYFRNGKFVSGNVSFDALETAVPALHRLSAADKKKMDDILASLKDKLEFGKVADSGFITRGGASLQFPPINISLDVSKAQLSISQIDYATVGAQLVRVLLEAIFDAHDGLPAVSNATGVALDLKEIALPDYQKIKRAPKYSPISQEEFGKIDSFANQVDGAVAVAAGRALRGGGPLALNNEALAKLLESAVGTSVRKAAEKLGWCWYAARPAGAILPFEQRAAPLGTVREVSINVRPF